MPSEFYVPLNCNYLFLFPVPDKLPFINFTYGGKRRAVAAWNPLDCGHRRGEVWYEYKLWILEDKVPEEWAITYETINVFKLLKRGRTYNITVRTATTKGASDQLVAQVTIPEGKVLRGKKLFYVDTLAE